MTAHIVYEAVDPRRPATLSPTVIRLIRETIGFGGLLMTDDLSMGALPGTIGERARGAHRAGCDLILHCNGKLAEMAVLAEAGTLMPMRWPGRGGWRCATGAEPLDIAAAGGRV
jgi:beta-N-acetylhexosaminidase